MHNSKKLFIKNDASLDKKDSIFLSDRILGILQKNIVNEKIKLKIRNPKKI